MLRVADLNKRVCESLIVISLALHMVPIAQAQNVNAEQSQAMLKGSCGKLTIYTRICREFKVPGAFARQNRQGRGWIAAAFACVSVLSSKIIQLLYSPK